MIQWIGISFLISVLAFSAALAKDVTVVSEEAYVFSGPDFDADTLAVLPGGTKVQILEAKGYFFKVKLPNGKSGYVADADLSVKIGDAPAKSAPAKKKASESKRKSESKSSARRVPIDQQKYIALMYEGMNFQENTQGTYRTAQVPFIGIKYVGSNALLDGDFYTDTTVSYSNQAPSYYKDMTGKEATADIVFADFLLETPVQRTSFMLTYFGLGPMLKYSHFLIQGQGSKSYVADDLTIGAVFSLGASLHFGKFLLRPEARYYWEKARSTSLGISFGYAL